MLKFGKYKGKSFEYIFLELEDYSYLTWLDSINIKIPSHIIEYSKKMCSNYMIEPTYNELVNG